MIQLVKVRSVPRLLPRQLGSSLITDVANASHEVILMGYHTSFFYIVEMCAINNHKDYVCMPGGCSTKKRKKIGALWNFHRTSFHIAHTGRHAHIS